VALPALTDPSLSCRRVACCGGGHSQLQLINFEYNRSECLRLMRDNSPDIAPDTLAKVRGLPPLYALSALSLRMVRSTPSSTPQSKAALRSVMVAD
jgi:hypothetical protein